MSRTIAFSLILLGTFVSSANAQKAAAPAAKGKPSLQARWDAKQVKTKQPERPAKGFTVRRPGITNSASADESGPAFNRYLSIDRADGSEQMVDVNGDAHGGIRAYARQTRADGATNSTVRVWRGGALESEEVGYERKASDVKPSRPSRARKPAKASAQRYVRKLTVADGNAVETKVFAREVAPDVTFTKTKTTATPTIWAKRENPDDTTESVSVGYKLHSSSSSIEFSRGPDGVVTKSFIRGAANPLVQHAGRLARLGRAAGLPPEVIGYFASAIKLAQ